MQCTLVDNDGGAIHADSMDADSARVSQCTFFGNAGDVGVIWGHGPVSFENTIIAFNSGPAIGSGLGFSFTCCDLYGNSGGNWDGFIADQYGIAGNISEPPLFCDPGSLDLRLHDYSACVGGPAGEPEGCGLIGAWPVGEL